MGYFTTTKLFVKIIAAESLLSGVSFLKETLLIKLGMGKWWEVETRQYCNKFKK